MIENYNNLLNCVFKNYGFKPFNILPQQIPFINKQLSKLKDEERIFICKYFGLGENKMSYAKLSKEFSKPVRRIRVIVYRALFRLHHLLRYFKERYQTESLQSQKEIFMLQINNLKNELDQIDQQLEKNEKDDNIITVSTTPNIIGISSDIRLLGADDIKIYRITCSLFYKKIRTVGDLVSLSRKKLLEIESIGIKTINRIDQELKNIGFELKK